MKPKKRILEIRSTDLKTLVEIKNDKIAEVQTLLAKAKQETRAFSDEENAQFEALEKEIKNLNSTIEAEKRASGLEVIIAKGKSATPEQRATDETAFLKFIRGEERALTVSDNGAIIPTTIASRIIEKVKELSPIYEMATKFNVGGDLVFPVYDETTPIQAAYVDDLTELTEQTGKFTTVKLQNFIVGCLAKISKSLMNRSDFDLVSFVVEKVAKAISDFLEKECLIGTSGKMTGVFMTTNEVVAASSTAITVDELIDVQDTLPDALQANACWIMHKATRKAIRKLKDADGNYLLNKDITTPFGYVLLGKPVYTSENAATIAAGANIIAYGDMSGLYVKLAQNIDIQVLLEKYATQHAIGVVGYIEADSKIVEPQKLVKLKMKA